MSTEASASAHLYLFIYAVFGKNVKKNRNFGSWRPPGENCLLTCAFDLNINISLFTYENRCQHKQMDATTCICLFMQSSLLKCAFALNINISLFTYDNLCQHKQVISFFFQTSHPELNKE